MQNFIQIFGTVFLPIGTRTVLSLIFVCKHCHYNYFIRNYELIIFLKFCLNLYLIFEVFLIYLFSNYSYTYIDIFN